MVLLVDADVIDIKGGVCDVGGLVGVARPVAAHRQVEDDVEGLVKGGGVGDLSLALGGRIPVVLGVDHPAVHIPADPAGFPLDRKGVVFVREAALGQGASGLALAVGVAIVQRTIRAGGIVAQHFHDVDLAAAGPLSIEVLVGGHHPEGGQETLSCGHLGAGFKNTVFEVVLVLGVHPAGGVADGPVGAAGLHRFEDQLAVLQIDVFRAVHIGLQLVVDPARLVQLDIPVLPVEGRSVERILPAKGISLVGQGLRCLIRFHCRYLLGGGGGCSRWRRGGQQAPREHSGGRSCQQLSFADQDGFLLLFVHIVYKFYTNSRLFLYHNPVFSIEFLS